MQLLKSCCLKFKTPSEACQADQIDTLMRARVQVEHLCRLVLVAERFSVGHLRQHCLRQLATLFEGLNAFLGTGKAGADECNSCAGGAPVPACASRRALQRGPSEAALPAPAGHPL